MTERKTIALFAASRMPNDERIIRLTGELGTALGQAGFEINYGAGASGLMGKGAMAAAKAGAQINAFVLECYKDEEQIPGAHLIPVNSEQERFTGLTTYHSPVAFVMLPGSTGTLLEMITALNDAVYKAGPSVILINTGPQDGALKNYFDHSVQLGLIKADLQDKLLLLDVKEAVSYLTAKTSSAPATGNDANIKLGP